MRILLVHNYYQIPGGEEQVFAEETKLLQDKGHEVIKFTLDNDDIQHMSRLSLGYKTIWNNTVYGQLRTLVRKERPQVVHFHNTLPLISPAAYHAAKNEGATVVQTLHNYRLLCSNSLLFRNGQPCEECLRTRFHWPGIKHACYRNSKIATATVATMISTNRLLGTWRDKIDLYIALSGFSKNKFIEGGIPEEKIVVKPNFIFSDPQLGSGKGEYALYVGRLSQEKGLDTLLSAWGKLENTIPLKIVGDGPLRDQVIGMTEKTPEIKWLGWKPLNEIYPLMGEAKVLIFPTKCYENCPRVPLESFAKGTPVIAPDLGATAELIDHRRTGLLFRPNDPSDLAEKVKWIFSHPEELANMCREARVEYEAKYTADRNYEMLMEVYQKAMEVSGNSVKTKITT
ncbi:glycosyltransferase involved in cell wall biosynthesis [Melghirimyces profundicolus]|uniref:Glycosyltransferase involved in cell wall biosynthesis n=1 Tax=Melghirimyces profundicolus TaxID=1242148 RepID=A0A2T6BCH2_9BACL|nr:glycosyltransferase family 4 protein [Melghirimyces profundicolus]PTX53734.1 glycosyltransferase involved in cell wall biosynthesis [Melghirimyces profundicolus]